MTVTDSSHEYGSNVRPEFLTTLQIESWKRDETAMAQIRVAWKEYEALWDKGATTMGEIQAALAEVSRLVHDGH